MITDVTQRYVLSRANKQLWRYDCRWRTYRSVDVSEGKDFDLLEGSQFVAVVVHGEGFSVDVTIRGPQYPEVVLASAVFAQDVWTFSGDAKYWEQVPEYVLIPLTNGENDEERRALLRIADGAHVDSLEGLGLITDVVHVPDSRLVLLLREGGYVIYDPIAMKALFNHELAQKNPVPVARFRTKDEMWISDVDTMVKVEAKKFEPVDAAGSDKVEVPDGPENLGRFGGWSFAGAGELCMVTRPLIGDVLVLDTVSMLPVAHGVFRSGIPVDAVMVGRNTVIALSAQATPLRTRLRRVRPPSLEVAEKS